MDLIKTIDENADVQDFSEDSDAEVEVSCEICERPLLEPKCGIDASDVFSVSTDKSAAQEEGGI